MGRQAARVAARWPKPAFDIAAVRRYDPPMSRAAMALSFALFLGMLGATVAFLWNAHRMSRAQQALAAAALIGGLWAMGWLCERVAPDAGRVGGAARV
jgi:hypothetical protein